MSLRIPAWAPELKADGWANIHTIVQNPPRLTAVDAYLGDLNAHTLVLGKDCAPAAVFRRLRDAGHPDPYRHDPKLPTNRMLCDVLHHVGIDAPLDGSKASSCGLYYANAYWLLRDDGKFSGTPPNAQEARSQSTRMLDFIITSLPKLERIIAMGSDAHFALTKHYGLEAGWREHLDARRPISANGAYLWASSHLGSRGVTGRVPAAGRETCVKAIREDWAAFFR